MAKVLENQTLYQCENCGKRLLTKHGAKLHETKYCSVVRQREKRERQKSCAHKHMEMSYCRVPGEEHLLEPDYSYCVDCGMTEMDIRQQKRRSHDDQK